MAAKKTSAKVVVREAGLKSTRKRKDRKFPALTFQEVLLLPVAI
jgi:hypothetical protein